MFLFVKWNLIQSLFFFLTLESITQWKLHICRVLVWLLICQETRTGLNITLSLKVSVLDENWNVLTLGKSPTWCTITLYKTFIIVFLYMFRTTLCSSSGGRIVLIWCCSKHVEDYNNKLLYDIIMHQVGHLPRVVPGCTVSKTWNALTFGGGGGGCKILQCRDFTKIRSAA